MDRTGRVNNCPRCNVGKLKLEIRSRSVDALIAMTYVNKCDNCGIKIFIKELFYDDNLKLIYGKNV